MTLYQGRYDEMEQVNSYRERPFFMTDAKEHIITIE